MSTFEIWLLAVSLAIDCFTVSVASGIILRRIQWRTFFTMAFFFGFFQALMPLIGWSGANHFSHLIEAYDHWIAFGLLLYLGGMMIYESFQEKEEDGKMNPLCLKTLCGLGVATSIDALAVGVSLAMLQTSLYVVLLTIAAVTFLFSVFGVCFGSHVGGKFDFKLDLVGGLILIGIGVKILIEHLFLS